VYVSLVVHVWICCVRFSFFSAILSTGLEEPIFVSNSMLNHHLVNQCTGLAAAVCVADMCCINKSQVAAHLLFLCSFKLKNTRCIVVQSFC